jgi:hypothetical protein
MAIVSPIAWEQNVGATNSAQVARLAASGSVKGSALLPALLAGRGGVVRRASGYNLSMLQVGGGNMTVDVEPGLCYVPGSEAVAQFGYWVVNDASVNIGPFAAAHATQNRIDTVYVKVNDSFYSGATNNAQILIATGTPGSGSAASLTGINNVFKVGEVTVRAGATSIITTDISNNARYFTAPGGIATTRSDESTEDGVHAGELSFFNNQLRLWDTASSLWRTFGIAKVNTTSATWNPQADDLCWLTSTKMFNRYTGSAWEEWIPNVPRAHMRQIVAQTLTTSTWSPITMTAEDKDTLNAHSTSSNTSRYVAQRAGSYEFSGGVTFAPNATGSRLLKWMKNSADINGSQVATPVNSGSFDTALSARTIQIDLVVSDFVELAAWQNSGGNLSTGVVGIGQSSMSVKYLGS